MGRIKLTKERLYSDKGRKEVTKKEVIKKEGRRSDGAAKNHRETEK
jgi:hypothetical protein